MAINVWIPKEKTEYTLDDAMTDLGIPIEQKNEILSRRRRADIVDLRQSCAEYFRARGVSFPKIGKIMNRDHTSIIYLVTERKMKRHAV